MPISALSIEYRIVCDQVKRRKEQFIARLEKHLIAEPNPRMGTPCMLWQGYTQPNGYARINFKYEGKQHRLYVHRLFLVLALKRSIADGMEVGHECHTPTCVRHLIEQTRTDNMKECNGRQKEKYPF